MVYDLAILGGGPAGVAAGVYASRKRLKTVFVTKDFESQSVTSTDIQNWIGTTYITGADLAKSLKKHLLAYAEGVLELKEGELIQKIEKIPANSGGANFKITSTKNVYEAKTILIATGSRRRKLEIPGASKFENKGIIYCASCDGPLFADMDVAVIGGGNAAFESAAQLLAYCKSVTVIQRGTKYRADEITVKKVLAHPKVKAVSNTELVEIKGDKFVSSLIYLDKNTGQKIDLPVTGIFVEIGSLPNTDFLKGAVDLNETGHVVTDPRTQMTSMPGIWAAGDVTDGLYHQNNIAAGDGIKALEDIYLHIHAK
jgi:alkyl hydroperoxide reductase subunit F